MTPTENHRGYIDREGVGLIAATPPADSADGPDPPMTNLADSLRAIASFGSEETAFISGAGISVDGPTNGPTGMTLTRRALEYGFAASTSIRIEQAYDKLGIDRRFRPRLEAVLDIIRRQHGGEFLAAILADLRFATPNDNHRFFADHLTIGGRHLTANFDCMIERASESTTVAPLHFHGSFEESAGIDGLGATLARIQQGFAPALRSRIEEELFDGAIRHIVFVGYSGSDFFDMNPFLRAASRRGLLAGIRVTVIQHDDNAISQSDPNCHPVLVALADSGAELALIRGASCELLSRISENWNILPPKPMLRGAPEKLSCEAPSPVARSAATQQLYAHMGLFSELGYLFERGDSAAAPEIQIQYLWSQGKYAENRAISQQGNQGPDAAAQFARNFVDTRFHWIRGSYFRAYLIARRSIERPGLIAQARPEEVIQFLELFGRLLVHMRRCPDVSWFATSRRRTAVADQITDYCDSHWDGIGFQSRLRVKSVLADLARDFTATATDEIEWAESVEGFHEFESLSAALNYEQGQLRKAVTASLDTVRIDDFTTLHERLITIGLRESALRMRLLPGGGYAFPFCETLQQLLRYEVTYWHKVRLTVGLVRERAMNRSRVVRRNSTCFDGPSWRRTNGVDG